MSFYRVCDRLHFSEYPTRMKKIALFASFDAAILGHGLMSGLAAHTAACTSEHNAAVGALLMVDTARAPMRISAEVLAPI